MTTTAISRAELREEAAKLREKERQRNRVLDIRNAAPPIAPPMARSIAWKFVDQVGWFYSSGPPADAKWSTPAGMEEMRKLAIQKGLGWAAAIPEILNEGPEAIKALAAVHLREDSYLRLKQGVRLTDRDIVAGARYFKKDSGEAARVMEEVHRGLNFQEQHQHQEAIHHLFNAPPHEEKAARENFNKVMDGFKTNRPWLKERIEREQRYLKTQHKTQREPARLYTMRSAA
jgi:hypothetical protein